MANASWRRSARWTVSARCATSTTGCCLNKTRQAYHKAFDEAYKRTQKSELTAKIAALDKERDGYAYVIQKVAEAWAAKIEDESLAVHGVRVSQVFRDYGFRTSEALMAENAKIHNMEQKLANRDLVSDLQMLGLTELC